MSFSIVAPRLGVSLLLMCLSWAMGNPCDLRGESPAPEAASPPVAGPPVAKSAEGATSMDEINTQTVKITAAESKSHHLPAAEISLNLGKTGLSGRKFSDKGEYLSLSGPPGGPLGIRISHLASLPSNTAEWRTLIEKRFDGQSPDIGTEGEIKFAGQTCSALTCTTGAGPARAHHLLILVEVPHSKEGLLVDFYHRAGKTETPDPQSLSQDAKFAELSPSFSIRFE